MENRKIILTGATGFIGSHIAEYLCGKGAALACLARPESNVSFLRTLPVEIIPGDITDPASLRRACDGGGCVIHAAGKVGDWGAYDDFERVNVRGTLNVLEAAVSAGIRQVIITGTNACYGEEDSAEIKTEASPYRSHYRYFLDRHFPSGLNFYRDTKALAVQKAREAGVLFVRHPEDQDPQDLLGRVRHRGDPARADRGGPARAEALAAHRARHRGPAGHRHVLVPPDDQGVPQRRRRVHRREGQPWRNACTHRGGRAVD